MPGTTERLTVPTGHALDEIGDLTHSANALLDANQIAMQRERELRCGAPPTWLAAWAATSS